MKSYTSFLAIAYITIAVISGCMSYKNSNPNIENVALSYDTIFHDYPIIKIKDESIYRALDQVFNDHLNCQMDSILKDRIPNRVELPTYGIITSSREAKDTAIVKFIAGNDHTTFQKKMITQYISGVLKYHGHYIYLLLDFSNPIYQELFSQEEDTMISYSISIRTDSGYSYEPAAKSCIREYLFTKNRLQYLEKHCRVDPI